MSVTEKRRAARILLIEPEETVARICLKALQSERLQVEWVSSPDDINAQLDQIKPQLILVGDDFEGCLSFELCAQLRGKTLAPIMVLTTTDAVGFQVNCLQSGADDVVIRPVQPELLLAKVQGHLRRAYRYSVPPQAPRVAAPGNGKSTRGKGAGEAVANQAAVMGQTAPNGGGGILASLTAAASEESQAPDVPAGPPPDFRSWPSCVACNYMGPRERFIGTDEHGRAVHACPACGVPTRLAGVSKVRT